MPFMRFDLMKVPHVESNRLVMSVVPEFDDRTLVWMSSQVLEDLDKVPFSNCKKESRWKSTSGSQKMIDGSASVFII